MRVKSITYREIIPQKWRFFYGDDNFQKTEFTPQNITKDDKNVIIFYESHKIMKKIFK